MSKKLGRPIAEDAKRKVLMTRVDEKEYENYMALAKERGATVSELIRRLLHEEKTGRSRVGYCTMIQRDWVDAIKRIPEDNLEDILAYAMLAKMSLKELLIEFDRALDAEEIFIVDKKIVSKGEENGNNMQATKWKDL